MNAVDELVQEEAYLQPSGDNLTTDDTLTSGEPLADHRSSSYGIFDSLDNLLGAQFVPVSGTVTSTDRLLENIYDEIIDTEDTSPLGGLQDDSFLDGVLGLWRRFVVNL